MTNNYLLTKSILALLFFFSFTNYSLGVTYYSKMDGAWNDPNSWVTDKCGGSVNVGTYPQSADEVVICDGDTISLNTSANCKNLQVGGGTSGTIIISDTTTIPLSFSISGNVEVSLGGSIEYNGLNGYSRFFLVGGNLSNKGRIDLLSDKDNYIPLFFIGTSNSEIASVGGVWELGYMYLLKASKSSVVEIKDAGFSKALTAGSVVINYTSVNLTKGTLRHNNTGELSNIYAAGKTINDPLTIPADVVLEGFDGVIRTVVNNITYLQGGIRVAGGTITISVGAFGAFTPYGLYYQGNKCGITIQKDGVLVIAGAFKDDPITPSSIVFYMMGGSGRMEVGLVPTTVETFRINSSSNFTMLSGIITLHNGSNYMDPSVITPTDFELASNSTDVRGGKLAFGGLFTMGPQQFRFTSCKQLPGLFIGNNASIPTITVRPYTNDCQYSPTTGWKFDVLNFKIASGHYFDMIDTRTGATRLTMNITSADEDSLAFYNNGTFIARLSWVVFSSRYQYIGGNPATTFSSIKVDVDPFDIKELWTGPILKDNINVSDTTILFRNLDLRNEELRTGLSDLHPGFMSVNPNCGVFHGRLTRFFKKSKNSLDFRNVLNDYVSTDLPFYITDLQTIPLKREDGTSYKVHLNQNFATRTFRVAATSAPQQSGYISVEFQGYKNDILPNIKEILLLANYIDFGSKINAITGCNWSVSSEVLRAGTFEVAAKNSALIVDNSNIQQLRLLYTVGDKIYGPGTPGFNSGSCVLVDPAFPYYHIFEQPTRFTVKPGYEVNGYVVRKNLFSLFSKFFIATQTDFSREWNWGRAAYDYGFPLAFRYTLSSDPYPFPTIVARLNSDDNLLTSETDSKEFSVSPNPVDVSKLISISIPSKINTDHVSIQLVNMFGKKIVENDFSINTFGKTTIDLSKYNLEGGIYMILVSDGVNFWKQRLLITK